MTKNLYYRQVLRRQNIVQNLLLDLSLKIASYPRLFIEVFIRKNFGQRYFSPWAVIVASLFLILFPWIGDLAAEMLRIHHYGAHRGAGFPAKYLTWYAFVPAFLIASVLRFREIKKQPSVFNFGRFSLYQGDIHPFFRDFQPLGLKLTPRQIETIFEPALFLAAGLLLYSIGQALGMLLILSSVFYSLSYAAAYKKGDDFIMDQIDEMLMNEEMTDAFVNDNLNNAKGVRFYAEKPDRRELRRKVAESMIEKEAVSYAK